MERLKDAQAVELFHVAFLDLLARRVAGNRYTLKGGANLRYFFGSVRYSEDIDLDIEGIPEWRLAEKIEDILSSTQLQILLRATRLRVVEASNTKKTETTQRWKVGIAAPARGELIRTKIEFSYREAEGESRLEQIPSEIVAPYGLRPPVVQHYVDDAPIRQKVLALAGRSETQARDVFDLQMLLRLRPLPAESLPRAALAEAAERALQLDYDAYRGQVLPFLELDAVELYGDVRDWEEMQTFVAQQLEQAA
jgi:predicted nucleotidyltransferase component of viral defense system